MKKFFSKLFGWYKKLKPNEFTKDYVVWVVEKTDTSKNVVLDDPLIQVAPEIHLYPEALKRVGCYGRLSDGYAMGMVAKYGERIPYEVEEAIIMCEDSNLIYVFTRAGVKWSEQAKKLMKKEHPLPYRHNVLNLKK